MKQSPGRLNVAVVASDVRTEALLRHTMVTLMLAEGENPKLISEMAGHATIAFTLDRYGHVLPGMGKQAAARMQRLLVTQES